MASFVQRALMYLGLKDIDDEEDYDGDDEEVPEAARAGCGRAPIPNLRRRGQRSPRCGRSRATTGASHRLWCLAVLSCVRS